MKNEILQNEINTKRNSTKMKEFQKLTVKPPIISGIENTI